MSKSESDPPPVPEVSELPDPKGLSDSIVAPKPETAATKPETTPSNTESALGATPRPLIAEQGPGPAKTSDRKPVREPKEWFARLRIREDRLARLWVTNLTGRDVVVWSPKEKRWVAMLSVPELRHALKTAEAERAQSSRSVAKRPSTLPPTRLSQPPATLPPAPPPPLALTHTSTAGELRLQSIAQGASRTSVIPREFETARRSFPSNPPSSRTSFPRGYSPSLIERVRSNRWKWRAIERAIWVVVGVLLVLVSGGGSSDEASSYLDPPVVEMTADAPEKPRSLADWFTPPAERPVTSPAEATSTDRCAERESVEPPASEQKSETHSSRRVQVPITPRNEAANIGSFSDFDLSLARIALINAGNAARGCPGSSIGGRVVVTFDPSGIAREVDIPLLIGDGVDRDCIARTFKSVRVPRFEGGAVAVRKEF